MIALNPDVAHCGAATLVVACQQAGVALRMTPGNLGRLRTNCQSQKLDVHMGMATEDGSRSFLA